jgi:type IV pilus assembly protein PilE
MNRHGMNMNKQKGFSLIELMITITIIGIIMGIAVPSYQENVMKSARGEGMSESLDIMRSQENYFANNFTYTTDLTALNHSDPHVTASNRYEISASACSGGLALTQCVLLTAEAIGGQVDDGDLTLDSQGNRTHGSENSWIK